MRHFESAEQAFLRKRTNVETPPSAAEQKLWDEVGPRYGAKRPREEDFGDLYEPQLIAKDRARLREKTHAGEYREAHERATLLEAFLWYHIEQQNWLGENVFTVPAAELDEKLRGVDFVVEVVDGKDIYRVGIDVTLSSDPEYVQSKWKNIMRFAQGMPSNPEGYALRYFQSEADPKFRKKVLVPHLVMGLDGKHYQDLVAAAQAEKNLAHHPVKELLISEIKVQAARMLAELSPNARRFFEENLRGILKALNALPHTKELSEWVESDTVFRSLRDKKTASVSPH